MKPPVRLAALTLICTLLGLSGCVWPDGGGYGRGGEHSQRRGGDDQRGRDQGCGDQHRDDCRDHDRQ